MKKYFSYNPYSPQEVKNEIHQIDANGLIRLVHVPAINSISIKNFEAITPPAKLTANKFLCEYSLDTLYREANRIVRFDKSHAGQVVSVNYLAVGSPVTADDMNEIKAHLDSAVTLISGIASNQTTIAAAIASLNNRIPDDIEAHNTSPDAHQDIRDLIIDSQYSLPTATRNTKGGVKVGDGLKMTGETLNCTLEVPEEYILTTASDTRKGGVKVGNGLEMAGEVLNGPLEVPDTFALPTASKYTKGGVKIGEGLAMSGETLNCTIEVPDNYSLPTASNTRKGGVKVGNGLEMDGEVLNVTLEVPDTFEIPTASKYTKGGVKIGEGLEMENGTLHCTVPPGVLTTATTTAKGLMSAADKKKLNGIEYYAQENVIEQISVDGDIQPVRDKVAILSLSGYAKKTDVASGMHIKGSVEYFDELPTDAIPGDVWNIKNEGGVDGNGDLVQAGDNVVFTTEGKWDVFAGFTDFSNYVTKVPGKQLSTNDFTNELKEKLLSLSSGELPIASTSELGGVIVGSGLKINGSGVLTTDIDIPDAYTLPTATASVKGGVKVGSGLKMSGDTLNCTLQVPDAYTLPSASTSTKGGVKVGSGLQMAGDTLNCTISNYTLPAATKVSLGGIIPGEGLGMAGDKLDILYGEGLSIANNTLTVTMVSGGNYDVFTGATNTKGGTSGLVPPPTTGQQNCYLRGNGKWETVSAGTLTVNPIPPGDSIVITSGIPDVEGALWYEFVNDMPMLRLRSGERVYNFKADTNENVPKDASPLVPDVDIIYQLTKTTSTVMGGIWYQNTGTDDAPVIYVRGNNFQYLFYHDTQTYVGPASDKLVAYLPLNTDEIYDACGNAWTTEGSPAIVTNPVTGGKAFDCNGKLSYKFNIAVPWTIDCWLTVATNYTVDSTSWKGLFGNTEQYGVNVNGSGLLYLYQTSNGSAQLSSLKGQRVHLALVSSTTSRKLYVNGECVAEDDRKTNLTFSPIFRNYNSYSGFYIDHFRIRSKAVWTGNFTVPDATEYI